MQTIEQTEANIIGDGPTLAERQCRRYSQLLARLETERDATRQRWIWTNTLDSHQRYLRLSRAASRINDRCDLWFDRRDWEAERQQRAALEGAYGPLPAPLAQLMAECYAGRTGEYWQSNGWIVYLQTLP